MSIVKLNIKFVQTLDISERGRALMLDVWKRTVENPDDQTIPDGYRNAQSKLPPDADEDLIITTIVGEVLGVILQTEVLACNPPENLGLWTTKITGVEYAEPTPPLPPPEHVQPQVLEISRQHG